MKRFGLTICSNLHLDPFIFVYFLEVEGKSIIYIQDLLNPLRPELGKTGKILQNVKMLVS